MSVTKTHTRINMSLTGSLERSVLLWLAARMPAWVTPDVLTGLGIFASVLIFASFVLTNISPAFLWLASLGVFLNWFGDSLDGTLARYRKIERPLYGFFVDHAVDSISETLVFIGMGLSPYVDFQVALLALISYLLLSIYVYLHTYVKGVFRISFARLGPTEVRMIAIIANGLVFFIGNPVVTLSFGTYTLYTLIVGALGIAMLAAFLVVTIRTALELSKSDREAAAYVRRERKQTRRHSRRKARSSTATPTID